MNLLHVDGKPYVLLPMAEYRRLTGQGADMGDLPADLADRIAAGAENPVRLIRRHRGLTQVQLAELAGLSRPYLAEIERGKKTGSVAALQALATARSVPVGVLVV